MNMKQNGYTLDEAAELLTKACPTGELDTTHDWPQLNDVYLNREPRYAPDVAPEGAPVLGALGEHPGEGGLAIKAADLSDAMLAFITDKEKVKGEPTGIEGLDRMLGGGKRLGEVTCWHAEAKTGKNTLWHKLMHLWLKRGIAMGYASRELTPETEVLPNILSLECKDNVWLGKVNDDVAALYRERLAQWPLYFAKGYGLFELDDIRRWMDELQALGVAYFWFDHLHYMLDDPEDHKAASKLIKELKSEAKRRNVHIDIIIQPNKLMDGQRLSLNSIKGGAAMGQAIDNLLILERVKDAETKNVAKLTLDVARSKLAKVGHVYLQYNPDTTDFEETEVERTEPAPPTAAYNNRWDGPRIVS